MKTLKISFFFAAFMAIASLSFGQNKTETFKVSGNCGMCKSKIEKAAKEAGATDATWNAEAQEITVKYKSSSTNAAKIQKQIASVGYDNAGFKATDEAYSKLHGCCKYDRAAGEEKAACCADHKDGGTCSHEGKEGKADCCKDGKCSKPGHDGKDCCKKS